MSIAELEKNIEKARMQVHTDAYPMSIGELTNLYDDGDLDIHPEFQRIYRWSEEQKSKLIESILLGIPLPSIFVAQRQDGVWDVVDGLQRISTILSFMGKLKNEKGSKLKPLKLQKTKYLPTLENKVWKDAHNPESAFSAELQRIFKREKIDIKIIKRESDSDTQFELFQRLNTGGSRLSDQEVRNCMLIMHNKEAFLWLKELSENKDFKGSLPTSDKQTEEAYEMELALRFFVYLYPNQTNLQNNSDINPYINSEMISLFEEKSNFDFHKNKILFEKVFSIAYQALEDSAFKKYNSDQNKYKGAISLGIYQISILWINAKIKEKIPEATIIDQYKDFSKSISENIELKELLSSKTRPIDKIKDIDNIFRALNHEG